VPVPADGGDDLEDEECAAPHASIEEAERELDAGQVSTKKNSGRDYEPSRD
jgi:hypothetical protein